MSQRFYADPAHRFEFANGAVGYRPGLPFDPLGPYAKVVNCPVRGHAKRLTCYATGYADTCFSIPACTRIRGKYVGGYFALDAKGGIEFRPLDKFANRVAPA